MTNKNIIVLRYYMYNAMKNRQTQYVPKYIDYGYIVD